MRYGEALLNAGKPQDAIDYIRPDSTKLSKPAWVIAERMRATAEWAAGADRDQTLGSLEGKEARKLGFAHQVRVVRDQKRFFRRRDRKTIVS